MIYRWKGENVATTEVSDILMMVDCIEEANVYGVKVKGTVEPTGIEFGAFKVRHLSGRL